MRKLLLPAFSAFFISFIFLACDVGLGEAVDTEKPTVSIEYPQNGAIIKEDFVVSGKCADDSGIKSVKVTLVGGVTMNIPLTRFWARTKNPGL